MKKESLYKYLLLLGDNSMILAHRLSELCGHGPALETDIALTNISLDLFGQVRSYFQYAAELKGGDATEDSIAFLRYGREHYNCILLEQPNVDFGHVIARQFFFDLFQKLQLEQLVSSNDKKIAAIAVKSLKETKYHLRFSSEWIKRLGDGTEESHERMQSAIDNLYPFVGEFFKETDLEKEMKEEGIGADLFLIKSAFDKEVMKTFAEANLKIPEIASRMTQGKYGIHTEQLDYILNELQYMQRAYPNMEW